ncbi:tail fiber domain-containing protein [Sphingobium yanoikuyae]|uniref:tail fiber domain-containing protein n=1 Tax=Sphingobium yanoikuyae TaxID=13690 RepID=UPI0035C72200
MPTVRFQLRRDSAANWTSVNPTLADGEPAVETDTRRQKLGNGVTPWNSLAYVADGTVKSVNVTGGSTGLTFSGGPITASGSLTLGGTLALANGGTGATTQAGARTALGLGTAATQNIGTSGATVPLLSSTIIWSGGQTFTSAMILAPTGTNVSFFVNADAGYAARTVYRRGTSARWLIGMDGTAESGSNVGTDFYIDRFNDAGASQTHALTIERSSGTVTIGGHTRPGADNSYTLGTASLRWGQIYSGTSTISTSDRRAKQNVEAIPAEWLDAWGEVEWCRYRFRDAVRAKGDDARWHVGLVAQQVHAAFAAHGIDAFEIGLLCFDEWEEQREHVISKAGKITDRTRVTVKAGNRWGLRYEECFAIEAAYQRRRMDRLEAMLNQS